jgi:hypothetical protein
MENNSLLSESIISQIKIGAYGEKSAPMNIVGGSGISVSGNGNSWALSYDPSSSGLTNLNSDNNLIAGDGIYISGNTISNLTTVSAGQGINVSHNGNDWSVSSNLTIYTIDICVNGDPKKIDIYVAGQPY